MKDFDWRARRRDGTAGPTSVGSQDLDWDGLRRCFAGVNATTTNDPPPIRFGPCPKCWWRDVAVQYYHLDNGFRVTCQRCSYTWTDSGWRP